MTKLIIKNGKFYRGEEEVKPEFGNTEQIQLMKEYEQVQRQLEGEGVPVDYDIEHKIEIDVRFKCLCGGNVYFSAEVDTDDEDDEDDAVSEIAGAIKACPTCKKKYELDRDEDGDLVVKKASNKKK